MGKVRIVRIKAGTKTNPQMALFHLKTFQPSSIPIGKRLKRAIQALKVALKSAILEKGIIENEITARARFVIGPAIAVFPTTSLSANPAIITAPGEIILKNGEIMDMRVSKTPSIINRNSAHKP